MFRYRYITGTGVLQAESKKCIIVQDRPRSYRPSHSCERMIRDREAEGGILESDS